MKPLLVPLTVLCFACSSAQTVPKLTVNPRAAADYSAQVKGDAVLVMQKGKIIFQEGQNGYSLETPHVLFSGTKSFSCAIALSAVQDGLLDLNEPISRTITEWKTDSRKSKTTVRQLLSLSSGLEGGSGRQVPTYAGALEAPTFAEPGTAFQYGPNPFQVFGEVMRRKLGSDPLEYLKIKVLDPIGLKVARWTYGPDGNPRLPQGAFLTAAEWVKYGQLFVQNGVWQGKAVLDKSLLEQCFKPSSANPNYGLTFWLTPDPDPNLEEQGVRARRSSTLPTRFYMAAGAGKQRLYILPDLETVVVRLGRQDSTYSDATFLEKLLDSK